MYEFLLMLLRTPPTKYCICVWIFVWNYKCICVWITKYCICVRIHLWIHRPRSFLETGFRPLYTSFGWFVPLSRTKRVIWISTRKPNNPILSEPGSILVDGFDTRLIPWSFSCGLSSKNISAWPVVFQTKGLAKIIYESCQTYEYNRGKQHRWHGMRKVTPVKIKANTKHMAYHLFYFQKISLLDL